MLENCGFLIEVLLELQHNIGKCLLSVILYGSSVKHGCRRGHDIDLFVILSDDCKEASDVVEKLVTKIHQKYGYILSINIAPLSRVLQDLASGDKFVRNVVISGISLHGDKLLTSLKHYVKIAAPIDNIENTCGRALELTSYALAIFSYLTREAYSACGAAKSAANYLREISRYSEDAEHLAEKLAQLCHKIAGEEDWSPRQLRELINAVRRIVNRCNRDTTITDENIRISYYNGEEFA